jgi:hypothetical protein
MSKEISPGPWLRVDTADYAEIHSAFRPSSQAIALVGKPEDADAIACLPELIEALREQVGECFDDRCEMCARHEAILRKCSGEAPDGHD